MSPALSPEIADVVSAPPRQDARDLLTHLYREIGIAAVAAALQVRIDQQNAAKAGVTRPQMRDLPAILRGDDQAA